MRLAEVHVGDGSASWARGGFTIEQGNTVRIQNVAIKLQGEAGINKLVFEGDTGVQGTCNVNGVPCEVRRPVAAETNPLHTNGITSMDHIVMFTMDIQAVVRDFQDNLGIAPTRGPVPLFGRTMAFYRVGDAFIEVVTPSIASLDAPGATPIQRTFFNMISKNCAGSKKAFMWGFTFQSSDLHRTREAFLPHAGEAKVSSQSKQRKIFTVRNREIGISPTMAVIEQKAHKL